LPSSPLLPLSPAEGAFSGMKVTSMHTLEGGSQCCQFLQNWAILQCCHICVVTLWGYSYFASVPVCVRRCQDFNNLSCLFS